MNAAIADASRRFLAEFAALSPRGFDVSNEGVIKFGLDGLARPVDVLMPIRRSEGEDLAQGSLALVAVSVPYPPERSGGGSGGAYRSGAPDAPPLTLRRVALQIEAPSDRRAKRTGIAHEIQVGDARFDDRVYVDTDADPAQVAKLLSDGGLRELILRALEIGVRSLQISTDEAIVTASATWEPVTPALVAEIARIAADIADRLPPIRHVETRLALELWPLWTAIGMLPASWGLHQMADAWYPTADSWLDHAPGVMVALSSIALALPLAWLLARARAEAWFRFLCYAIAFSFAFPIFTYMGAWFANGFFDRSPEVRSIGRLHEHGMIADDSPTYWLRVDSWRPGETVIRLEVTEHQYRALTQPRAERVEVVRRRGALGAEWLVGIHRK